ncbi:MAG: SbcC/MukB-like Walker B domain-containing protein [Candidatus Rifleibacteriota bacterium]
MFKGYSLKRIRLINFHNFLDETISINGHLFLIGGNGSGKTTVLDAVHFVFTAGKPGLMELNSAARMANQPKNLGRTLQGIFLRYDLEKGQRNNDKTIGYAALEFQKNGSNEHLCIGCGALATNLQTRPDVWGFEAATTIDKLELTSKQDGKDFPISFAELKSRNFRAYPPDRYIDVITKRFFDSKSAYRDTMNLIAAGKSYRELVSRFQDQSQLFRELLPPPDEQAYREIQRSLRDIEQMQASSEDQKLRLEVLETVALDLQKAGELRERVARIAFIQASQTNESATEALENARKNLERIIEDLSQSRAKAEKLEHDLNRKTGELDGLKNSEIYKQQQRLGQIHRELDEVERSLQVTENDLKNHQDDTAEIGERRNKLWDDNTDFEQRLSYFIETGVSQGLVSQNDLSADAMNDFSQKHRILRLGIGQSLDQQRKKAAENEYRIEQQTKNIDQLERRILRLEREKEAVPDASGYLELQNRLTEEGIDFVPFYRLLEPTANASENIARIIEEILGPQRLCAIIVAPGRHKKARAEVLARAYDIPIVENFDNQPPAPPMTGLRQFLNFNGDLAASAENYAAAILDDFQIVRDEEALFKSSAGKVACTNGMIKENGSMRRVESDCNRFIGTAARQSTRNRQIEELKMQKNEIDIEIAIYKKNLRETSEKIEDLKRLLDSVDSLVPQIYQNLQNEIFDCDARLEKLKERREKSQIRLKELGLSREKLLAEQAVLLQLSDSHEFQSLTEAIAKLENEIKKDDQNLASLRREIGKFEANQEFAEKGLEHSKICCEKARYELQGAKKRLLELLTEIEEDQIEHHVFETHRGKQIKVENVPMRLREAEIAFAQKCQEISTCLSQNTTIQRSFHFSFDVDNLSVKDQNEVELTEVCNRHRCQYEETRAILEKKNRKLFEELILNDVVRRLIREEETLRRTIDAMNKELRELKFGNTTYSFSMQLRTEYREFRELIRSVSDTDESAQQALRNYFDAHRGQLVREGDSLPDFLDYRKWHDVVLQARTGDNQVTLTRRRLSIGSGGEQSVPNYILLLSLAKVHLDHTGARFRIILMDEAFYGIDPQRRDELLNFADRIELTLIVAHPELDGVTESMANTTTLLVEKTAEGDVFLGNFDFSRKKPQAELFDEPAPDPDAIISVGPPQ